MAKTIVLYYSATGTTKQIAEYIAQQLGADIHEVQAAQPYTSTDLNWHDESTRATVEQHQHNSRVAIKDDLPDMSNYDNVIIGHPIWWGIPPRLIATLIDQLDLTNKHVALFATSGGSNYDRSQSFVERTIKENGYAATINNGAVLNRPAQVDNWLLKQNFKK